MKEKSKENEDRFKKFKKYYINGREVVDLTSVDEEYEPVKFNFMDIERQQIYGNLAKDSNKM